MTIYDNLCYILLEINKNLKILKGIGIAIKGKGTSSKLALLSSYEITGYPVYKLHWLLSVSLHTNTIPTG